MQLRFEAPHLSIKTFPSIALPDFTLITGPNGAGKSHLLNALELGKIRIDDISDFSSEIRYYDWNTLVPQETGLFTSEMLRQSKINISQTLKNLRQSQPHTFDYAKELAKSYGLPPTFHVDTREFYKIEAKEILDALGAERAAQFTQQLKSNAQNIDNWVLSHLNDDDKTEAINISQVSNIPVSALDDKHIFAENIPSWGKNKFFQQSFARLFIAYSDLYLANQIAQLQVLKGIQDVAALSDNDFITRYGIPPWDFVNISLKNAGLDFKINNPETLQYSPYEPRLTKISNNTHINFSQLSSGEKVLISFAFCVYYARDKRQISTLPKLLLLDEIDAPLHPSMTKSLISTINQTLVKDFGIKVIATTHSPSTVALAPDDALYTMAPNEAGLKATSKAEALNILTVGVPTLAISFHGRRQVFVESPADAAVYDALYSIWNVNNKTERSLDFISPGLRSPTTGQDVNTGCEAVLKIVNALRDAGNSSVFGLLDWDGARTGQPRIIVLAEGKRNGLENVLLDPLLVAAFIARDGSKADKIKAGIPEGLSYLSFLDLSAIELQKIVECIETAVLPQPPCSRVTIHYAGGLTLSVGEEYLTVDDHELENLVLDAFPFMRAFSRSAGKLMQKVVSTVLTDKPSFMPDVIGETFELLLNEPAHQS